VCALGDPSTGTLSRGTLSRPVKTSVALARKLAKVIVDGQRFGERLQNERDLMAQYGVARGTLREALRLLEVQELITIVPGAQGGPTITRPSASSLAEYTANVYGCYDVVLEDIIKMRLEFEPVVARAAASECTAEEVEAILESAHSIHDVDEEAFFAENQRFHELVAASSHNPAFLVMIAGLREVAAGNSVGIRYSQYNRNVVADRHEVIARMLERGDAEAAEHEMREHMAQYYRFVKARRPDLLERRIGPLA
jgi:GntR family transcriptional repressor for pyruvate dehydrogenase complex